MENKGSLPLLPPLPPPSPTAVLCSSCAGLNLHRLTRHFVSTCAVDRVGSEEANPFRYKRACLIHNKEGHSTPTATQAVGWG